MPPTKAAAFEPDLTLSVLAPTAALPPTVTRNSIPGVPSVDLTPFCPEMEMSFGPESERVSLPVNPGPKIRIVALDPRATAPPTFEAEMVVALGEFTPSRVMLNAEAVLGTTMLTPVVFCPFATATCCGAVRLPPLFEVPPPPGEVGGVGVVGVLVVVLDEPPPQPIQNAARSKTGNIRMRMIRRRIPKQRRCFADGQCCTSTETARIAAYR